LYVGANKKSKVVDRGKNFLSARGYVLLQHRREGKDPRILERKGGKRGLPVSRKPL